MKYSNHGAEWRWRAININVVIRYNCWVQRRLKVAFLYQYVWRRLVGAKSLPFFEQAKAEKGERVFLLFDNPFAFYSVWPLNLRSQHQSTRICTHSQLHPHTVGVHRSHQKDMKEAVSVATLESASVAPLWRPSVSRSPSSIFRLRGAFALVPWNMDAVWKEERRATFHCHMRTVRKRSWWRVFQRFELLGKYSMSLYQPVFSHPHLPSEFQSLPGT